MIDPNYRQGDAKSDPFGQDAMLKQAPVEKIPDGLQRRKWLTRWSKTRLLRRLSPV